MKVLELFSGTHSIGNVCHELGWDVVSLDRDLGNTSPFSDYRSEHHIKEDIMTWDYKKEFNIGNIINWGINNTSINSHRDDSIDNHNHIRYNLCILKPFDGGDCVYDNKKISLMERHYIKCNATKFHSTTSVIGIKPRIMVSYGILTKK